jgi:hypothetical protein
MTTNVELPKAEYRQLILEALPSAVDAETTGPQIHTLFTPTTHRNALAPDATIVRGARGVGKTVWYTALQSPELRDIAAQTYTIPRLRSIHPIPGYGSQLRPNEYPGPATLTSLMQSGYDAYDIWTVVLLVGLADPVVAEVDTWRERIDWVRNNPEHREQAIALADNQAVARQQIKLLLFDALDRLSNDRTIAESLITGILRLALDLRTRTRQLRAKVFIRPDMLETARLQFTDASKLLANAADLGWSPANLYGLVFNYLGNASSEASLAFRRGSGEWVHLSGRYQAPNDLVRDSVRQQEVFEGIAGKYMGTDYRKGRTYTWLPSHLVDGIGQVSPRSFLSALRRAAEVTEERFVQSANPLHPDGIREGVQAASQIRVQEIAEDLPWVSATIEPLRGLQVPMEKEVITQRWREHDLESELRKQYSLGEARDESQVRVGPRSYIYGDLIPELMELGVMSRRADGRIDLPDVYRIAFGIGRKGGVRRIS